MEDFSKIKLRPAQAADVDGMIRIYQIVYGKSYPISYGNDPDLLRNAILNSETHMVYVAEDTSAHLVVAALILERDLFSRIGKVLGLVVHPEYQHHRIGHNLVQLFCEIELVQKNDLNSLYATTRTISIAPQNVFYRNGFLPLGIFPNAHRLKRYETVSLFAKFREGLLSKRIGPDGVSEKLIPLYTTLNKLAPEIKPPPVKPMDLTDPKEEDWEFEVIQAPDYVRRKFLETFPDPSDRFFPFHFPNTLVSERKGRVEIFAYFSKRDGYCTLIKSSIPLFMLHGHITSLYLQLHDIGVTYLEVLVNTKMKRTIETLLRGNFLPSAIYPAMREIANDFEDYVVMSRTMESLNFKGMALISPLKPYIDQYIDLWKKLNLDTLEIVEE